MQAPSRMAAFASRGQGLECPSCGSDEVKDECGRNVCGDCGIITSGGSNISRLGPVTDTHAAPRPMPSSSSADAAGASSPIRRVRDMHPACERGASELAKRLPPGFTKGMSANERARHSQALAYLVYRDDGCTRVTVAALAAQIRVPEERLSKDVRKLAGQLGIRGWNDDFDDDDADVAAFSRAVLGVVRRGALRREHTVRGVHRWCRNIFAKAIAAGDVELANQAPKHQADGAVAAYCRTVGTPFVDGAYGPPTRARTGPETEAATAVRYLLRAPSARKAAASLQRHVDSE